jgi:Fe2+ transport system protein FeoA
VHNKVTGGVPLSSLAIGASARLSDSRLAAEDRDTLRALGLTDGATLRVCKQGEPCVVQVRSTRIGITGRVAQAIFVEPHLVKAALQG